MTPEQRIEDMLRRQDERRERDRQEGPHMPGCPSEGVPLELATCGCGRGYYPRETEQRRV